jgi:hypothetical protein
MLAENVHSYDAQYSRVYVWGCELSRSSGQTAGKGSA